LKNLIIICARTNASRFPQKSLKKLNGMYLIENIIYSMKFSKLANDIVLATTKNKEDDILEKIANKNKIKCFRGSEQNVLERMYQCSKKFNADYIVRITGDNPLQDPYLIDSALKIANKKKCDYVTNTLTPTFPLGYPIEIINFKTLEKIYRNKKDKNSKEHITYDLCTNPKDYYVEEIFAPKKLDRPSWRLTVDYPEDLKLIKIIYKNLFKTKKIIKYKDVILYLDNNPNLLNINKKYYTKKYFWTKLKE